MSTENVIRTELAERLTQALPRAYELRRLIHSDPRLSGDEADTLELLLREFEGRPSQRIDGHGGVVRVGEPTGPSVALRVELDALPLTEQTEVSWRARNAAMHACGHDVHMAAAVALARAVHATVGATPLVLALQPREEQGPSGALDLLSSSAFEDHEIRAVIGVHVQPRLPLGTVAATAGPVNAASDTVSITVAGRPGHGAYPHTTADPVVAAANLIGALQTVVSRQADPMHPAVFTIGTLSGGTSPNIVPESVSLSGTLRTFDEFERTTLTKSIVTIADGITAAHGCTADVDIEFGEPVLVNDHDLAHHCLAHLASAGLKPEGTLRSCGADDFAHYGLHFPSLMMFTGVGDGAPTNPGLHHPRFLPTNADLDAVAQTMLAGYLGARDALALPAPRFALKENR
jgi:amidohydrolase